MAISTFKLMVVLSFVLCCLCICDMDITQCDEIAERNDWDNNRSQSDSRNDHGKHMGSFRNRSIDTKVFTINFSIDANFSRQLLNQNSNLFNIYRKRVEDSITFAPYGDSHARNIPIMKDIKFSPGSIRVSTVVSYDEQMTTESVYEDVAEPVTREFQLVTDTLEVHGDGEYMTTENGGENSEIDGEAVTQAFHTVTSDDVDGTRVQLAYGDSGYIQVYHEGEWGTVCDDVFGGDNQGCTVVCRTLGFSSGMFSQFGPGDGPIWLDSVRCDGSERGIEHCQHNGWGNHDCRHEEDAGCRCCDTGFCEASEEDIQIQLSEGASGVVQVYYGGQWGTLCDDSFDENDNGCTVICRMLGYSEGHFRSYGSGSGPIWLDDIVCTGTEDSIAMCDHAGWGNHDCRHVEDAGCACVNVTDSSTADATEEGSHAVLWLSDGNYGTLHVYYNDMWGTVCDDVFSDNNVGCVVACKQIGFSTGVFEFFGPGTGEIWLDNVECSGSETYLDDCVHHGFGAHDCDHDEDAGCRCLMTETSGSFDIRLTNGDFGTLEVYHNGAWGTVCDDYFDEDDLGCSVVCSQLGFSYGVFQPYIPGSGPILLDDVRCTGTEDTIASCVHSDWGDHNCDHSEDSGCKCCNSDEHCGEIEAGCNIDQSYLCVDNFVAAFDNPDFCSSAEYYLDQLVLCVETTLRACDELVKVQARASLPQAMEEYIAYCERIDVRPPDSFVCGDGEYIPMDNVCDGYADCRYSEDERQCGHDYACSDGPFGGDGGTPFSVTANPGAHIIGFRVCESGRLGWTGVAAGLDIYFSDGNFDRILGCVDRSDPHPMVTLSEDEYISEVEVVVGEWVANDEINAGTPLTILKAITFFTDMGNEYGPYGDTDGNRIRRSGNGTKLIGLFGGVANVVDYIGLEWDCAPPTGGSRECFDGPFGGSGGHEFDSRAEEGEYITGFRVCETEEPGFERIAAGIDLYYSNGYSDNSVGCFNRIDPHPLVELDTDEFFVGVRLVISDNNGTDLLLLRGIAFKTNTDRIFGPYGSNDGIEITVSGFKLIGIFGANGVAIDSIGFYWECPPISEENSLFCDFETVPEESCLYEDIEANFNWTRHNSSTDSYGTGPYQAYSNDWYMYIETSSPRISGESAKYKTKTLILSNDACLSFSLSMYGQESAFLTIRTVIVNEASEEIRNPIYKEGGYSIVPHRDISSFWSMRYIPLYIPGTQYVYLEFEGTAGTGSRGDIAVDYITVDNDHERCESNAARLEFEQGTVHLHEYLFDNDPQILAQLFYRAGCVLEGLANPLHNTSTSEYYSSLSMYSVWNMMQSIYRDSTLGSATATKECYGEFPKYRRNIETTGGLRLMYGDRENTAGGFGRVEIMINNRWRTVCDDGFDSNSAAVLCTHLGYSGGEVRKDGFYGQSGTDESVFLSAVHCGGSERHLYECVLEQNTGDTCSHANGVGVLCIVENSGPNSYIGPNETTASSFENLDDTVSSIFIPNAGVAIERNGNLTQWTVAFRTETVDIFLQVWRGVGVNIFQLVGQNHIRTSDLSNAERDADNTTYIFTVSERQAIPVEAGDVLGFHFPTNNPIPFTASTCYKAEEQLRYVYKPPQSPQRDEQSSFGIAPLSWDPCRTYMLQARIDHDENDWSEEEEDEDDEIPKAPFGSLLFDSFEDNTESTLRCTGWTRQSGPSPSIGTGPFDAARGRYYMYAEASQDSQGQPFTCESEKINLKSSVCVSFFYHMHGPDIGRLQVHMVDPEGGSRQPLLDKRRSQFSDWLWYSGDRRFQFSNGKLLFTATMGSGFQGDIAFDNVLVTTGKCQSAEDLTGEAIAIPTRDEATEQFSFFEQASLETSMSYVGGPDASDSSTACTQQQPCTSLQSTLEVASKNKTIIIDGRAEAEYSLNLSSTPQQIKHLNVTVTQSNETAPHSITLSLSGSTCFESLTINNLKLTGGAEIDCDDETAAVLILSNVVIQMENSLSVRHVTALVVDIETTVVINSLLSFSANDRSSFNIRSSNFNIGSQESNDDDEEDDDDEESSSNRKKRDTQSVIHTHENSAIGLLIEFPTTNSRHIINVKDCTFAGLYQHRGTFYPMGAFTVINSDYESIVNIIIEDSKFEHNERALDFSVKGDVDIAVTNSEFIHNYAEGSGGAIRITSHLEIGLGAIPNIKKGKVVITNCTFAHNMAQTARSYSADDIYYQSRSPGSGGAIFVSMVVPSQLLKDGLVTIEGSSFTNNTADIQGGTLFVNPDISLEILSSSFSNTYLDVRPKFGDVLFASSNMTIRDTSMVVVTTDRTTPIVSYGAGDTANYRLLLDNFEFECPVGHWIEQLNTTSFSPLEGSGVGALQMYCRGCQEDEYSLNISHAVLSNASAIIDNSIICTECPYGAECNAGILNTDGFWGIQQKTEGTVKMFQCPEEYCSQKTDDPVNYHGCAPHRVGTLCGHCADGYSESLFGTKCIHNGECGSQNWWVIVFFIVYGVLYVFFFMFQGDWEHFISWISKKMKRHRRDDEHTHDASHISDDATPKDKPHKANSDEFSDDDNADFGKSGYFPIFMYFIQTASLLKVNIIIVEDEIYKSVYRPQDILPPFLIDGIKEIFSLNIKFIEGKTCVFENLTVVSKTWIKLTLVSCLFGFVVLLYVFSAGCCVCFPINRRPRIGLISNTARILITIMSLFLYTYQSVAEDAFLLLNCVSVDGERVLFYDGNVSCLQEWQYAIIVLVTVFVIPFFVVLLFGPKLLEEKRIGIILFMLSCVFPLFMSIPICWMYYDVYKKMKAKAAALPHDRPLDEDSSQSPRDNVQDTDSDSEETNICCGDVKEIRDEIVDLLSGPYRLDIFGGVCYEGILNFRRMVMVVLFTFLTDVLLRQMALSFTCFVILLIHLRARPFKQAFSNYVETVALSLLLIMSGTNMVKAAFYHSQTVPRGTNYLIIVIYEWVEAVCIGILPLVILAAILIALVVETGSKAISKKKDKTDGNENDRRWYDNYTGRHSGFEPHPYRMHRQLGNNRHQIDERDGPRFRGRDQPNSAHALRFPAFDHINDDRHSFSSNSNSGSPYFGRRKHLLRTDAESLTPVNRSRNNSPRHSLNQAVIAHHNKHLPRTDADSLTPVNRSRDSSPHPSINERVDNHNPTHLPRTDATSLTPVDRIRDDNLRDNSPSRISQKHLIRMDGESWTPVNRSRNNSPLVQHKHLPRTDVNSLSSAQLTSSN